MKTLRLCLLVRSLIDGCQAVASKCYVRLTGPPSAPKETSHFDRPAENTSFGSTTTTGSTRNVFSGPLIISRSIQTSGLQGGEKARSSTFKK